MTRVYPRVCGGTTGKFSRATRRRGLSPRVRGNQNRIRVAFYAEQVRVYPRVCGGTDPLLPV